MNISLNLMSLVIGVIVGAIPVLVIMYFRLKHFAARIQHADALHRSEVAASVQLTKQAEDTYLKKIVSLEKVIQKIESSAGSAGDALNAQLLIMEERHKEEIKAIREELTIEVHPYQHEDGSDGYVVDDRYAEVGYKYQLFVRGIPCFEAHKVSIKTLKQKEVSREKVLAAARDVLLLMQSLSQASKAFKVMSPLKV